MKKIFLILLLFSLLTVSCDPTRDRISTGNLQIKLPDADIVFQTIEKQEGNELGKEILAFLSLTDGAITKIDFGRNLMTPHYINSDTLVSLNKWGYPGTIIGYSGNVFIIKGNTFLHCDTVVTTGRDLLPYKENFLIISEKKINLVSSEDCSLQKVIISEDELSDFDTGAEISSYSLSKNGDFLIVSLYIDNKLSLENINLSTKSHKEYKENGINPSISPDQSQIAYLGRDGIHLMGIDGENNILLVPYETNYNDESANFWRDNLPIPNWLNDGTKIIYHKCIQPLNKPCDDISDYNIFEFDLKTSTEILLIKGGINPSYRP